jgi:hypothetical protein
LQARILEFTNATEVALRELDEVRHQVREKSTHYLKVKNVAIKVETPNKDFVRKKMYFTEETEDLMYQYKYLKLYDHEIVDSIFKYCAIKEGHSLHLEDSKLQSLMQTIYDKLEEVVPDDRQRRKKMKEEPAKVVLKKTMEDKMNDLQLEIEDEFEMSDIDKFWPNFKILTEQHEKDRLGNWLNEQGSNFFYKNFAKGMLNINKDDSLRKKSKDPYIHIGKENYEIECIYHYLFYVFKRIRKMVHSPEKNTKKFDEAYNLLSEAFIFCGLINYKSNNSTSMPILKFFYILLDCFPTFRTHCYRRIQTALKYMSADGTGRNVFQAELELQEDGSLIKDLVMILLMEFDISSEEFLYTLNLLEYLCDGNTKFNYLGLFLGDFYDFHLIGALKYADDDKRLNFYQTAEKSKYKSKSENSETKDKDEKLTFSLIKTTKARLSIMYQMKFEKIITEQDGSKATRLLDDKIFHKFYENLFSLNKELMEVHHPVALMFFVDHYIKSNQYKLNPKLIKDNSEMDKASFFTLQRGHTMTKAAENLNILHLLGDTANTYLYYRVLKQLRLQEVILPAMRLVGEGIDENYYIPLAYCKEKGIGGSIDNEFALDTYRKATIQYIESGDLYKIGQVIYRIGLMLDRGENRELGEQYFLTSLIFILQSNLDKNLDKKFLFEVAKTLLKLQDKDLQDKGRTLLNLAYEYYPKKATEYLVHYEIEKKLTEEHEQFISKTKQSMNTVYDTLFMATSFHGECQQRQNQSEIRKIANNLLNDIRTQVIERTSLKFNTFAKELGINEGSSVVSGADLLKSLESLDKKGYLSSYIQLANLRMSAKILSTNRNNEIENTFKQIKLKKEKINQGQAEAKSAKRKTELLIQGLVRDHNEVVRIEHNQVEKVPVEFAGKRTMDTSNPCLIYETYRFKDTQQRCTRITAQYNDIKGARKFLENFEFFLSYNPFLLNYYGLNYDQAETEVRDLSKWTIHLYAEYFERTADSYGPDGFLEGHKLPLDKVFKIAYQLIIAVRSLHVIGKVSYFVSNQFIGITPDYDIHLIIPFFEEYFRDPKMFVEMCELEGEFSKYAHLAPENFAYLDDTGNKDNLKTMTAINEFSRTHLSSLSQRCDYFPLLQKGTSAKQFWFCAASDIWSLGLFFLQLFSSKPFFEKGMFSRGKELIQFMNNHSRLKSHVESKLRKLPSELPKSLLKTIRMMLRVNPLRRPTIEAVLSSFEHAVFNQLYSIPPATPKEMNKIFFKNAYFDIIREVKIEQNAYKSIYEDVKVRLPKGMIYEGKAIRGIPNGKGFITHKGVKLVSAEFEDGVICGTAAFKLGHRDFLEVKNIDCNVPRQGDRHISSAIVLYNRNQANKEETQINQFEKNTWIPMKELLKERFSKFGKFDEATRIERKNKRKYIAHKSLKNTPLHIRKTTIIQANEVTKNIFETIGGQIEFWIDDLKRKDKSVATNFSFGKKDKKNAINLDIMRYQSGAKVNASPDNQEIQEDDAFIDEENTGIQELNDLTAKELQEELEKYLNFATLTSSSYDFVKKTEEFARTDLEQLRLEEKELEKRDVETTGQVSQFALLLMGKKPAKTTKVADKAEDSEVEVDMKKHHTMVTDAFGNSIRVYCDRGAHVFDYSQGVTITHLDPARLFQTAVYCPNISPTHIFVSRVASFSLCDFKTQPPSFGVLNSSLSQGEFDYAIITELKDKQFRGAVSDRGPEIGTLFIAEMKQHISYHRGTGDSYKGMVVDLKNHTEYEGSLVGTKKHGFGKLKYKDKVVYIGNFKDGLPHGKGLFFDQNQRALFKGIFKEGKKKYGTTFAYPDTNLIQNSNSSSPVSSPLPAKKINDNNPSALHPISESLELQSQSSKEDDNNDENIELSNDDKEERLRETKKELSMVGSQVSKLNKTVEINGIYHLIPSSTKHLNKNIPLISFILEMSSQTTDFVVEGSIREKKDYPIYYTTFRGLEFKFTGPVKINFGNSAYFFGYFVDGLRKGLGVMCDENGGKFIGQWLDKTMVGFYESKEKELRTGTFDVASPGVYSQHGLGKIEFPDGTFYKGQVKNNLGSGYGLRKETNGNEYRGEFEKGNYERFGCLDNPLKHFSMEGFFKNNQMNDYGIYKYQGEVNKGYWVNHIMKAMYCDDEEALLAGRMIESMVSEVEYNTFEGTYSKKGICFIRFLKLIREDNTEDKIVSDSLSLILQVVLLTKYKHKDAFKLAYFILEEFNSEIMKLDKKPYDDKKLSKTFDELATSAIKNIIHIKDNGIFKVEMDFSRDTYKSLEQKYSYSKVLVKAIVNTVIYRLSGVLKSDNSGFLEIFRKLFKSRLMDPRKGSEHEKLRDSFRKEFFAFVSPAISELNKLLNGFEKETKKSRAGSRGDNSERKENNNTMTIQNSFTDLPTLNPFSQALFSLAPNKTQERASASAFKDFSMIIPQTDKGQSPLKASLSPPKQMFTVVPALDLSGTLKQSDFVKKSDTQQKVIRTMKLENLGGGVSKAVNENKLPVLALLPTKSGPHENTTSGLQRQNSASTSHLPNTNRSLEEPDQSWEEQQAAWATVRAVLGKLARAVDATVPDRYEGEVFNDEVCGYGSILSKGKLVYTGEFKENEPSGLGEMMLLKNWVVPDDNEARVKLFRGIVEKDLPNGLGILIDHDNSWEGKFVDGKRDGIFICRRKGRIILIGQYDKGCKGDGAVYRLKTENKKGILMTYKQGELVTSNFFE